MIHIGLCADDKFAMPLGVCITSIFESNRNDCITVHILTSGLSKCHEERLKNTASIYNQFIHIYKVDDSTFDGFPISKLFPKTIYYRYLFTNVLPESISKIIYLDCDTIVLGSLDDLYNISLNDAPLAAVEDRNSDDIVERNRIGIYDGKYFNSGVMILNLDYWRKNKMLNKLCEFIKNNPEKCLWPDQDALNILLHNEFILLPFYYNFLISFIEPFEQYRLHKSKRTDIIESFQNIVVLHYATKEKPWNKECRHPLSVVWRHFYKLSLWKNDHLRIGCGFIDLLQICVKKYILKWPRYQVNDLFVDRILQYQQMYN